MQKIIDVCSKEDYLLAVSLDNGSCITLDFKPKLATIRFGLLRNKSFFQGVETDGTIIHWTNKIELSLNEIFEMQKSQGGQQ